MYCVYQLKNDRGQVYFGITKDPKARLRQHRSNINDCTSGILWKDGGIVDDIKILEWFDTEDLALEREKDLIRNNICVNLKGNRGTRKEQKSAHSKKHYEQNKEKINARGREKIKCDVCGFMVTRNGIAKHQKTKKCKSFNEPLRLNSQ